jgi:cytochrome b561
MKCVKTCPFKAIIPAGKQQKDTGTNRKMSGKRAIVSIGLSILFILLIVSAIVIEIKEELIMSAIATEIKEELNPQPFSLHVWTAVHVVCGTIFTVFVIFHLVCNWRIFKSYLIRKNK